MTKGAGTILLAVQRDSVPEELREFKISLPLESWNRVVKQVRVDRKLLGGILLDLAQEKDLISTAVGNDRLYSELQRVVVDATASLIETGALSLTVVDVGAD